MSLCDDVFSSSKNDFSEEIPPANDGRLNLTDLIRKDCTFTKETFLAKVDNTFIMLLSSIMTDNLSRVDHKIGDNLYNECQKKLDDLNKKNQRIMYDELNVKNSNIVEIREDTEKYYITAQLYARYLEYTMDKTSNKILKGDLKNRKEVYCTLYFEKQKGASNLQNVTSCPGCGANIDFNNNGKCPYCGSIFNTEKYDWVLTNLEMED